MLSWRQAFQYPTADQNGRSSLLRAGVWLLICPPLGWLLALGYRADCAWQLWDQRTCSLPEWPGCSGTVAKGGKALGVIFAHLLPAISIYWMFGLDSLDNAKAYWPEILGATAIVPVFPPVTIPGLALGLPHFNTWLQFTGLETVIVTMGFALSVFILPAAFLQVSVTRRFASALNLGRTVVLIRKAPRLYCEAWLMSIVATSLALVAVPLLPWTIPWSYLVIGFAFNEALMKMNLPEMRERAPHSVFFRK